MRIVLLCNEPSFRMVLAELLSSQGYQVDACRDIEGATREIAKQGCDLVIVNLLGEADGGLSACRELRRVRPGQKIAFIHGRWTPVRSEDCPDDVMQLEESPKKLLARVTEILQPETPAAAWQGPELSSRT